MEAKDNEQTVSIPVSEYKELKHDADMYQHMRDILEHYGYVKQKETGIKLSTR